MKIEVLISTMHQKNYSLLKKMNIRTNAIVVNQCNDNSYNEFQHNGNSIIWINTTQRGLSKSRNMALSYAKGDICLIADEDIEYFDDYEEKVLSAYAKENKADFICFNITRINGVAKRAANKDRKAPSYKSYPSVSISFRRIKIIKNGLHFNELIGAGSQYGAGEESLFLIEGRRLGLIVYENSAYICKVDFSTSTWFTGYNEKFYFDTGVYLAVTYRKFAYFYMMYFILQSRRLSKLPIKIVIKNILNGISEFQNI